MNSSTTTMCQAIMYEEKVKIRLFFLFSGITVGDPEIDWPSENTSRPIVYCQNMSSLKLSVRMQKEKEKRLNKRNCTLECIRTNVIL